MEIRRGNSTLLTRGNSNCTMYKLAYMWSGYSNTVQILRSESLSCKLRSQQNIQLTSSLLKTSSYKGWQTAENISIALDYAVIVLNMTNILILVFVYTKFVSQGRTLQETNV